MFTKKKEESLNLEIARLKHEIEDLRQIVKTQELIRLRNENAVLKEKEQLISKISFHVKSVAFLEDENKILVKYEIPQIKLSIDNDRNIVKNDFFYAINRLQLISFDDMKKIQNVINSVTLKEKE